MIEESAEHRSTRERETDRVHITEHPHPFFQPEELEWFEGVQPAEDEHLYHLARYFCNDINLPL
jgi:hypothetical protein